MYYVPLPYRLVYILCDDHLLLCALIYFGYIGGVGGVSLGDVVVFATGCDQIPIAGFENQPRLKFIHDAILPTASTCGPTLCLPVQVEGTAGFSEQMRFALLGTCGFGQV